MGAKGLLVPLLICGLFLSCIQAQSWSLTSIPAADLDVWSEYVFITATQEPTTTVSITLSEASGTIQFSTTTLQYSPTVLSNSFRIKGNKAGSYVVDFAVSGSEFTGIGSRSYTISLRSVQVLDFPSNTYIGHPSPPAVISIDVPSTSTLTFTPSAEDNAITFSPASITLNAGSLSAPFTFIANDVTTTSVYVTWSVSGAEADRYYTDGLSTYYAFGIRTRPFSRPTFSGKVLLNAASPTQYMYVRDITNATVTVTPQAADTTFNPATFTFTPGTQVVPFTYTTTSPKAYNGDTKPVSFVMTGEGKDFYSDIPTSYISIPKRTIYVELPYTLVLTNETLLSIQLWAPTPGDVTVSFFASRLTFNVSSVTFSGNKTSAAVTVSPIGQGTSTVSFLITGADADLYETIDDLQVSVGRGSFLGPSSWYIPTLWVGVESDKIPIRASFSPKSDVTLFFSAPDLKFSPTNVTFRPGQEQQFFTITPLYTSNDVDYSSTTVSFLVTGTDATYFNTPGSFSVTIARRTIQTRWSAHLEFDSTRHLQKEYKVWASANYVGEKDQVSVTPVSPYFSFEPSTLYFTAETTRIEFIAKVTGVVGYTAISYIIGGEDGGWYSPMAALNAFTAIRPLGLARAVLAPDDRVDGVSLDYPTTGELSSYHVYSFTLNSTVLPDSWITITPKSAHVEFSPSSITLHPSDARTYISRETYIRDEDDYYFWLPGKGVEANFTAHPKAAGVHDVWFELTGDDASYYDVPDHVLMSFWLERRADSEPSAASVVIPSLFAVILLIATIL